MKFNAKKCNIMRVSRSRKPLQHFYSLGNEILQEVSDAKYLGIQIDNKLDWNKHISTVAARGQSKLAFLNRNLKGCPKKLRDTAYISLITNTNTNNFILDIKYGTISVTIIYINKHDSRLNPGNRYKDICRGTSVTDRLPGQ